MLFDTLRRKNQAEQEEREWNANRPADYVSRNKDAMLLKLEKADGSQMYEEKNFAQWVKDAAKKEEQAKNSKDEWAGVR